MTEPAKKRRRVPSALVLAAAFGAGSVPFANIAARRWRNVDLRSVGTGTVSGTGLYSVAGFGPLAIAGVCEVAKGSVGPLLAGRDRPKLAAVAGGLAVVGHNWSPWLGGAGGRGISPAVGALLPRHWRGSALLLGGMAAGRIAGETAVGSIAADGVLVPLLGFTAGAEGAAAGLAVVVPMVVKRMVGNSRPAGSDRSVWVWRLLYDRDTKHKLDEQRG
jgi:glycerol-3-phosphate acyltransferase PlsY